MTTTIDSIRGRATITVVEAAEVCGVGKDAAYAAVHAGTLPSLRLGRTIRVPVPALLRVLGATDDNAGPASPHANPATIPTPAMEMKTDAQSAPHPAA